MRPVTQEEFAASRPHERIRHVRKNILKVTQAALATRLGVTERTVKGWEQPDQPRGAPDAENAAQLAEISGYPAALFMTPPPLETTIAEEISRKLDLLLVHLALGRPVPVSEVEAALHRLELLEGDAGRSNLGESQLGANGP